MIIGIDFDNTIISYDMAFHKIALSRKLITCDDKVRISKEAVREFLVFSGKEKEWTELQGYVYGKEIFSAKPYEGVLEVIDDLLQKNHSVHIISHKTQFPYLGPKYDLHQSAKNWIEQFFCDGKEMSKHTKLTVTFNKTIEEKINCIKEKQCEIFIDDLLTVFNHPSFPQNLMKILFKPSPRSRFQYQTDLNVIDSWKTIGQVLSNDFV